MIRLGLSAPGRFHAMGFQPTSIVGVLGSSLAVGRLMGLPRRDDERPRHRHDAGLRLLALSQGRGLLWRGRYGQGRGGWDARSPPGGRRRQGDRRATQSKARSASSTPTSGSGGYDLRTIVHGLEGGEGRKGGRTTWMMQDTFLKRYPTSYACTFMIDAAIRLTRTRGVRRAAGRRGQVRGQRTEHRPLLRARGGEAEASIHLRREDQPLLPRGARADLREGGSSSFYRTGSGTPRSFDSQTRSHTPWTPSHTGWRSR